jgi:hypothetical protein
VISRAIPGAVILLVSCSSLPKPDPALLAMMRNPKVSVSGVVVDSETGAPVAGIQVFGLPLGKEYPWEGPVTTDSEGRFALDLATPACYAFLLRFRGVSVVTADPDDPAYLNVETTAGHPVDGIVVRFLRRRFEENLGPGG